MPKKNDQLLVEIFGQEANLPLLAQAVRVHLANRHLGTKKTKGRGEVRGGGRKPWRQKGTGRARHGSRRSPLWVGGGHAHPLKPKDYTLRFSKKMKIQALISALSFKNKEGKILLLDEIPIKEGKTREVKKFLDEKKLVGYTLIITPDSDLSLYQAIRNLPKVQAVTAQSLTTYNVLKAQNLFFLKKALPVLNRRLNL